MLLPTWPLDVEAIDRTRIVRFPDETRLDGGGLLTLREHLGRLREGLGPCGVVLDLGGVSFVFSDALDALLAFRREVRAVGGHLILCNLRPQIREVFTVTRLDRVFDIRPGGPCQAAPWREDRNRLLMQA